MSARVFVWLPVSLLALLAAVTFWLNHVVETGGIKENGASRHLPDSIVAGVVAKQLGPDGTLRHMLTANTMTHYADDDSAQLETVKFQGFEKDTPPLTVESNHALVKKKGEEVVFTGNVLLVRETSAATPRMTMRTSYLRLIPDLGIARSNRPVIVEDPKTVIHAAGLDFNNKTRIVKLTQVKATYAQPN